MEMWESSRMVGDNHFWYSSTVYFSKCCLTHTSLSGGFIFHQLSVSYIGTCLFFSVGCSFISVVVLMTNSIILLTKVYMSHAPKRIGFLTPWVYESRRLHWNPYVHMTLTPFWNWAICLFAAQPPVERRRGGELEVGNSSCCISNKVLQSSTVYKSDMVSLVLVAS